MLRWVVVLIALCCVVSTAEAVGVESFILTSDEVKFGSRATDLAAPALLVPTSPLPVVLSGDTTSIEIYTFTLCNVTVVANQFKDKIVVVRSVNTAGCRNEHQSDKAAKGGASALVITVTNDYEQPDGAISCVGVSCPPKSSVFSCSGSKALFSLVKEKVESNDLAFTLDLSNIKKFNSSLAYPSVKPQHLPSTFTVDSPQIVRARYPVGYASFNPLHSPKVTAKLVSPIFRQECLFKPTSIPNQSAVPALCQKCWSFDSPFLNAANITGSIAIYDLNRWTLSYGVPLCHYYGNQYGQIGAPIRYFGDQKAFPSLVYTAQRAGAKAVIVVMESPQVEVLTPYLSIYPINIPTMTMIKNDGQKLTDLMLTPTYQNKFYVVATFSEIRGGTGPPFMLPAPELELYEEALVKLEWEDNKAREKKELLVGQSTYNPVNFPGGTFKLVYVETDPSCWLDADSLPVVRGTDCTKCAQLDAAGDVYKFPKDFNKLELEGHRPFAAVVHQRHIYCFQSYRLVAEEMVKQTAKGLLVLNEGDWTITSQSIDLHISSKNNTSPIPVYNVRSNDGDFIMAELKLDRPLDPGGVHAEFPPLVNSKSTLTGGQSGRKFDPMATEIKVGCCGASITGVYEAGQSEFNPTSAAVIQSKRVVKAQLEEACKHDTQNPCYGCGFLSNPFLASVNITDRVVIMKESEARCLRPLHNYVRFAEMRGAKGFIFVNEAENIVAILPHERLNINIPSFNLPGGPDGIGTKLYKAPLTIVTLPPVVNGFAVENYFSAPPTEPTTVPSTTTPPSTDPVTKPPTVPSTSPSKGPSTAPSTTPPKGPTTRQTTRPKITDTTTSASATLPTADSSKNQDSKNATALSTRTTVGAIMAVVCVVGIGAFLFIQRRKLRQATIELKAEQFTTEMTHNTIHRDSLGHNDNDAYDMSPVNNNNNGGKDSVVSPTKNTSRFSPSKSNSYVVKEEGTPSSYPKSPVVTIRPSGTGGYDMSPLDASHNI